MSNASSMVAENLQAPPPLGQTSEYEPIPQLSPALTLNKVRVRAVIDHLPESFTLDDLVERLIYLAEIDEGIAQAERGETIPHAEVMASARAILDGTAP